MSVNRVYIPRKIKVLSRSYFSSLDEVEHKLEILIFESNSELARIEKSCFQNCLLRVIYILHLTEILSELCFSDAKLEGVTFESELKLMALEFVFICTSLENGSLYRHLLDGLTCDFDLPDWVSFF